MKLFFVTPTSSQLADDNTELIDGLRDVALAAGFSTTDTPAEADALILNETFSFKEQRYVQRLLDDPVIGPFSNKLFTLNFDDCATGVLRGLYSSLPRSRFDGRLHAAIPYFRYHNDHVFSADTAWRSPRFLGAWRGNENSHEIRRRLLAIHGKNPRLMLESTSSWYNHGEDEKSRYVTTILDAKFSLCPAGLAPMSFRIFESMALGRAPVLLADDYVYPRGPDWSDFSFAVPEQSVGKLEAILASREAQAEEMGRKARSAWDAYFSRDRIRGYFLDELLRLIRNGHRPTQEQEIRRWTSWALWSANGWTVPQRAWRKLKRTAKQRWGGDGAATLRR